MQFLAVGWVWWSHLTKRSIYIKLSWQPDQRDISGTFCMILRPWSLELGRLGFDSQLCHLPWSPMDHETNLYLKCWRSIAFQKMSPHHFGGKFRIMWRLVCFPLLSLRTEEREVKFLQLGFEAKFMFSSTFFILSLIFLFHFFPSLCIVCLFSFSFLLFPKPKVARQGQKWRVKRITVVLFSI